MSQKYFTALTVDRHQAGRLLGLPKVSLAHLLASYCSLNVDKQYQLADWRIRSVQPVSPLLISPNVSRQAPPGGHGVLRAAGHAAPHLSLHQTEERAHQPRQRGEQPAARHAAPEQRHLQEEVLQARAPPRLPPRDGQEGQDHAQQQAVVLLKGWFRSYIHPPQEYNILSPPRSCSAGGTSWRGRRTSLCSTCCPTT